VTKRLALPTTTQDVVVGSPRFQEAQFKIVGTAPYVSSNFTAVGAPEKGVLDSPHEAADGWYGIPAVLFRKAMIVACRVAGFRMTKAKVAVFVEADGLAKLDGEPLVRFTKGKPHSVERFLKYGGGRVSMGAQERWNAGWEAVVRVRFDADLFALVDVANLMLRAGMQVGLGAGRPDPTGGPGMGWGLFEICK